MKTKTWNVRKHDAQGSHFLGTVRESTEEYARCAALSQYGRTDEEPKSPDTIGPDDDFDVTPALT
jgi:hypothetical protein